MGERKCRSGLHIIPPDHSRCRPCANAADRRKRLEAQGITDYVTCPVCAEPFQVLRVEHAKAHGYADLESFKQHFGLTYCTSDKRRKEVGDFFRGRPSGRTDNGQMGLKRSAESRAKMSASAVARVLRNPKPLFAGIRGSWVDFQSAGTQHYARSSYERRLLAALDAHPNVLGVVTEPFSIPYTFEGVQKRYIPDVLVYFDFGIKELWEVKPAKFVGTPQNQAKIKALSAYAGQNGMNAAVVTLADIEKLERFVALHNITGLPISGLPLVEG